MKIEMVQPYVQDERQLPTIQPTDCRDCSGQQQDIDQTR